MTTALLAALLTQAAPVRHEEPPPTAQQLYDACTLYLAELARRPAEAPDPPANACETASLTVALTIRGTAAGPNRGDLYCPPPATPSTRGRAHARPEAEAYLAFVDAHPQAKANPNGLLVFVNAVIRRWPCSR